MPEAKINLEEMFRVLLLETLAFAVLCAVLTVVAPAAPRPAPSTALTAEQASAAATATASDVASNPGGAAGSNDAGGAGGAGSVPGSSAAAAAAVASATPGANADARGPGTLTGIVYDAQTGKAVAGAVVQLAGLSKTAVTDAQGRYGFIEAPAGRVSIRVRHDNYVALEEAIDLGPGGRPAMAFALSAMLRPGQFRLVLTWETEKTDLDAHLWTPADRPYHVYYPDSPFHRGAADGPPFATLDRDSRKGNLSPGDGIETISIGQLTAGVYTYAVNQYGAGQAFLAANARVTLYDSSGVAAVFTPPPEGSGEWWNVIQIDGATSRITSLGTVGTKSPGPYP